MNYGFQGLYDCCFRFRITCGILAELSVLVDELQKDRLALFGGQRFGLFQALGRFSADRRGTQQQGQ